MSTSLLNGHFWMFPGKINCKKVYRALFPIGQISWLINSLKYPLKVLIIEMGCSKKCLNLINVYTEMFWSKKFLDQRSALIEEISSLKKWLDWRNVLIEEIILPKKCLDNTLRRTFGAAPTEIWKRGNCLY